ncbi:hypothetical protein COCOBI_05-5040 [Coccomyxa sp. Obi]|nr:hypothetical protein COCOBI_05-5040 [Coccomyxa sp. Obi]
MEVFQQQFGAPDTGAWYSTQQLKFRPRIACKRNEENPPILYTTEQVAGHVAARYGQQNCTLLEALLCTSRVKPYFDFELYLQEESETASILEQQVLPTIMQSLDIPQEDIRIASRHGWVKTKDGRKFMVSFRAFVLGKSLHVAEMNTVIGRKDFSAAGWDKGVYPLRGERMMAVALDGDEEAMDIARPKYATRCIARADIHSMDAAISQKADKPAWLTILDDSMLELASDYMVVAKMKGFTLGRISGNAVSVLNEPTSCAYEPYLLGTWQTKLPNSMDEMTEQDLAALDVNLVKMLLAANKEALAILYLNRVTG